MTDEITYIVDLDPQTMREMLVKSSAYFDMELPRYFNFEPILSFALDEVATISSKDLLGWKPDQHEALNYTLMSNKDGAIAWRPFELINPLVYSKCIELLTSEKNWEAIKKRFQEFSGGAVECCSMPVVSPEPKHQKKEQILNWWKKVEQRSLELSLEYSHCKLTDVSNCYPSIYSHAIGWAIHGRDFLKIKKNRFNDDLLGNQLDKLIRGSREGQTNGIPQASLLSHVLAELVLGYCDLAINLRLKAIKGVKVLRYRDDYRIFGHSDAACGSVLKIVSEELIQFGMRLGSAKTTDVKNLITGAVKNDKIKALKIPTKQKTFQKQLLLVHEFAESNPGAGALKFLLSELIKDLERPNSARRLANENSRVLIAILMDIGAISPNVFPAVATASSMILAVLGEQERRKTFQLILDRTKRIPNNGYLEIWLQRIAVANKIEFLSSEGLCQSLYEKSDQIWNFEWVGDEGLKEKLNKFSFIDGAEIETLKPYIEREEFDAFWKGYD